MCSEKKKSLSDASKTTLNGGNADFDPLNFGIANFKMWNLAHFTSNMHTFLLIYVI
jgi:hypothetical protein